MEQPRVIVGIDKVLDSLVQMRAMLVHRMKAPNIAPVVFNECRTHVKRIEEQLSAKMYRGTLEPIPVRAFTRAQRRKHQRAAGNTFTDKMNARKASK